MAVSGGRGSGNHGAVGGEVGFTGAGADAPTFELTTVATAQQQRALDLARHLDGRGCGLSQRKVNR